MEAIPDILKTGIPIGQLLIEFHYNYPDISFESTLELISMIRDAGFKILDISQRGYEFAFVHPRGDASESSGSLRRQPARPLGSRKTETRQRSRATAT